MLQPSTVLLTLVLGLYLVMSVVLYLNAKTCRRKVISSILMGIFFAVLAYMFVPESDFDLVRHHEMASRFADVANVDDFWAVVHTNNLEFLPQLFDFVIAKIGNYNLMQATIVLFGYSMLFYMLIDYKWRLNLSNSKFLMVALLTIFGQHILFYFSGLFNYFAINIFAFAVYLDYIKGKKKISFALLLLSLLIHDSMLLPFILLLLFKVKRGNISKRFLVLFTVVALLWFGVILKFVVEKIDVDFLTNIKRAYDMYVAHNDNMLTLYDGFYLFMSVTKIAVALLACWVQRKNENMQLIRNFIYLLTAAIVVLSISSIAFTRFSTLVLFIALPLIMDAMAKKRVKFNWLLITSVTLLGLLYFAYSVYVLSPLIVLE